MTPTVGRTVHYQSYGTPNGEHLSLARAAIITQVHQDNFVDLCVLNPTGMFFNHRVSYSDDRQPGTWSWPPRAE